MNSIVQHSLNKGDDAIPVLTFFRKEERNLKRRIKQGPLNAGIDFPKPVKKGTSHSGQFVILYSYLPPNASTNPEVTQVNLDSILPAASNAFNKQVRAFIQADYTYQDE